jgi:hypothetical protein
MPLPSVGNSANRRFWLQEPFPPTVGRAATIASELLLHQLFGNRGARRTNRPSPGSMRSTSKPCRRSRSTTWSRRPAARGFSKSLATRMRKGPANGSRRSSTGRSSATDLTLRLGWPPSATRPPLPTCEFVRSDGRYGDFAKAIAAPARFARSSRANIRRGSLPGTGASPPCPVGQSTTSELEVATRRRAYISPVLLEVCWRRKRLWSAAWQYRRYWAPAM